MTCFWVCFQEFETDNGVPFIPLVQEKVFPDLRKSLRHFYLDKGEQLDIPPNKESPNPNLIQTKMIENPKCQIHKFGYSDLQAAHLFPPRNFKSCSESQNTSTPLFTEVQNKTFTLSCPGEVSKGLSFSKEEFGNVDFPGDFERIYSSFSLNDSEYFFARCEKRISAYFKLQERVSVYSKVKKTQENLSKKIKKGFNPLSVHIITFDSLSRQSFFRNFPKTVSFLNSSKNFQVFDQHLSVVHGSDTQANLIPLFYGHSSGEHWEELRGLSIFKDSDRQRFVEIQEKAIWRFFERLGFVTMFSYDTVWDYFSYTIGRKVMTDHVGSRFFHAAKKFTGYQDFKKEKQCIGNESSDFYSLKYLTDFSLNYKNLNKFSYSHLSQGHEHSGTVIASVDQNLEQSLKIITENYLNNKQDFVLFLIGDHGKHSNEWDLNYEGILENRLPLWITLSNKQFLSRINAKIKENQEKLVSRLDFFLTLKHLATCPYGRLEKNSPVYKAWQKDVKINARSVFLEDLPFRTCEEVGILEEFCPCEGFKELEFNGEDFIQLIFEFAVEENKKKMIGVDCHEISLGEVLKVSGKKVKEDKFLTRFLKISASIKNIGNSKVEILAYLTTEEEMKRLSKKSLKVDYFGRPSAVYIVSFYKEDSLKSCSSELICYC